MSATLADLLLQCCQVLAVRADKRMEESKIGVARTGDDLLKASRGLMETADALERGKISSDTCLRLEQALKIVRHAISWEATDEAQLIELCAQLDDSLISPPSISYALMRNTRLIAIPRRRFHLLVGQETIGREAEAIGAKQLEEEVRKLRSAASVFRAVAETLGAGQE